MASFQFRNVKTGEIKVINSKDSVTAKRVYSNKTWEYVKAVPQQKTTPKKESKKSSKVNQELWTLACQLGSQIIQLREEARDYDVRFAQKRASEMEDLLANMQSIIRGF